MSGEKSPSDLREQSASDSLPPEFKSNEEEHLPYFAKDDNAAVGHGTNAFISGKELPLTPQPIGGSLYIHDAMNRMINNQNSSDWH